MAEDAVRGGLGEWAESRDEVTHMSYTLVSGEPLRCKRTYRRVRGPLHPSTQVAVTEP